MPDAGDAERGGFRIAVLEDVVTNSRVVAIGYVVLAILAGLFLEHILLAGFGSFGPTQPLTHPFAGEWSWASVIGLGITAAAAFYFWTHARSHEVSEEVVSELRKVTWPSMAETRAATIAVIVASLIAAVLLGLFDVAWQFLTDKIQNPTI